jgi:hypothetical protein
MPQPTVDEILIECSLHVGIGIPKGKHLTKKAIAHLDAEFRPRLQRGIDQGVDWAANRATVLSVCELLGASGREPRRRHGPDPRPGGQGGRRRD